MHGKWKEKLNSHSGHLFVSMAIRSIFNLRRSMSSGAALNGAVSRSCEKPINFNGGSLKNKILRLKSPAEDATTLLQNWTANGRRVAISDLRSISSQLTKLNRHHHALQIMKWMETRNNYRVSVSDIAVRVELLVKVNKLREAEEYFECLNDSASKKAALMPLLKGYVKERDVEKAEKLMMRMGELGLIVSPHVYNEMMKLYSSECQYKNVGAVIMEMKRNGIRRNVLSYNLWMSALGEVGEVRGAEMVYEELVNDCNVQVGWSSLATLANVYMKSGHVENAVLAAKSAERKLSGSDYLGYTFLMTLYSSLQNKEGVVRVWEASKVVDRRLTCANYMGVMLCLVKAGEVGKAENVFVEWESNCRNYDIRVSNVLLGAYVRNGLMDKAEALHCNTLEKGGSPNYKTWEILAEGRMKSGKMEKAVDAMKNGLSLLKTCNWRPSESILTAIAEHFEKNGNIDDANQFLRDIHQQGLASLPLYKMFLKMQLSAHMPTVEILKMMEIDEIELDDETSALVQAIKQSVSAMN